MAENLELQNFKILVEKCSLIARQIPECTFNVIKIQRYKADPIHCTQLGLKEWNNSDVYQLTLTDGLSKRKAILDPSLVCHVQHGQLFEGSRVTLKRCQLRYDETSLLKRSFLIIQGITVGSVENVAQKAELSWCKDCDDVEKSDVPLTSSRGYFLNIWSSAELEGEVWRKERSEEEPCDVCPVDLYTLRELSNNWRGLKNPPILVRIVSRKRILHYAKMTKNDKWPLQAHFTVCDRSGCATVVLWNSLCTELYYRLKEGDVLLIQRFTVKKSFHAIESYPSILPEGLPMYNIDINLNSHHPVGHIKVISLPTCIDIPVIGFNYITRTNLWNLPNGYVCDIVGLVTYIGRYFREKMTGKGDPTDSGGFWICRWVELIDDTSQKPFKVLLYRPSEINVCDEILPGTYIRCRHMRVVSDFGKTSWSDRYLYLTSTSSSVVDIVSGEWDHLSQSVKYTVGGYYNYPPSQLSIEDIQNGDFKITSSEEFTTEVDQIVYRESRRFYMMGHMVAVTYLRSSKHAENLNLTQDKKEEVIVHQSLYDQLIQQVQSDVAVPFKQLYHGNSSDLHFIPSSHQQSVMEEGEYFVIYWSGLNHKVLLPTVWWCPLNQDRSDPLLEKDNAKHKPVETLTGSQIPTITTSMFTRPEESDIVKLFRRSVESLSADYKISKNQVNKVLKSAMNCHHQFLLVLDVYKMHWTKTEIVLNMAYKL